MNSTLTQRSRGRRERRAAPLNYSVRPHGNQSITLTSHKKEKREKYEFKQNDRKSRGGAVLAGMVLGVVGDGLIQSFSWCAGSPFHGFREQHEGGNRRDALVDNRRWVSRPTRATLAESGHSPKLIASPY